MLCIWCWCQRKDHQGLSTEQEKGWALSEQRRKIQTLNGIWSGKLWWDIYGVSSHLSEKLIKVSNILFLDGESQRQESCMSENNRCQNGKWNKRWNEDLVFLPDHFLYRGVVRTVVHVLGSAEEGAENKKDKSLANHWLGVDTDTVTLNLCGRHYTSSYSWQLGNCSYDKHVFSSYMSLFCICADVSL